VSHALPADLFWHYARSPKGHNKCGLSANRRHSQQAKDADRLEPKRRAIGTGTHAFPVVDKRSPADREDLTHWAPLNFLRFPGKLRKDLTSITYIVGTLFLTEEASILIERLLVEEIKREQSSF